MADSARLEDAHGRRIEYLRVAVTDRCGMDCIYCGRSKSNPIAAESLLTDAEIERFARVAVGLGIRKVRLTGGEPLDRPGIENIVRALAAIPGLEDLSLTTNGLSLARLAAPLAAAGLRRVNISLDTLRPDRFANICRAGNLDEVQRGIAAARSAGMNPIKINVVVIRGTNEDEMRDFVAFADGGSLVVRFIEYMPINRERVSPERTFPRAEMLGVLRPLLADASIRRTAEPAQYFPLRGGGAVGLISPVTHGFCGSCNRLRITPDGALQTCLLSAHRVDLAGPMRAGADDAEIARRFREAVREKGASGDPHNPPPSNGSFGG